MIICAAKLSIDLAIDELFSYIFHGENMISVNFFSNTKFETRVYSSFWEAKSRTFFFYTFSRRSRRKVNIFKKTKMGVTELIRLYNTHKKQLLFNVINILKFTTKNVKKRKK